MLDFKTKIAEELEKVVDIDRKELESYIEVPKDTKNGDYSFPCFRLAKELKKAPQMIANDIKEKISVEGTGIEKVEVVGGFLNFFIDKETLAKEVLNEVASKEEYGRSKIGEGRNIVIDYSAPNIAKPFHIGHLRSTVIGGALSNIYKFLGYNVTGINHLGDYGTQFGKLIEGYKLWGDEYDIDKDPINELTKIYIRINNLCKEDESVLEACRDNFKKLEEGDSYCTELWEKFKDVSLKEFQRVYDLLGSKFESWNGEAFYSDKMPEVIELLEKSGKLVESQGAKIVDLSDDGIDTPCIIIKSNGSTTYATRDLAAILYRTRTYDFEKALYVTSYEQVLHFKQVFATAKYLGLDEKYLKGLKHIPFGMVLLPTGKMSTREGNIIKLEDLLNEAIERAKEIIEQKNPDLEDKEETAKKVGIGAVIFNDLSNNRVKDEIFDWDTILNFQGETGPYIQYMYVRIRSLSRYLIDLAKAYSSFYNENKIMVEDKQLQNARVYLSYATAKVLKEGTALLGMEMPNKM